MCRFPHGQVKNATNTRPFQTALNSFITTFTPILAGPRFQWGDRGGDSPTIHGCIKPGPLPPPKTKTKKKPHPQKKPTPSPRKEQRGQSIRLLHNRFHCFSNDQSIDWSAHKMEAHPVYLEMIRRIVKYNLILNVVSFTRHGKLRWIV